MSTTEEQYIKANENYVKNLEPERKDLPLKPSTPVRRLGVDSQPCNNPNLACTPQVIIITCMDARIVPSQALGLAEGETFVVRNVGGRTVEAIRSLVIAQQFFGTKEIIVLHHTDCGLLRFKDPQVHEKLKANPPRKNVPIASTVDSMVFLPISDTQVTLKEDVEFLKGHPLLYEDSQITGWIFDVKDGKVTKVI
ncbi:hypothetical protein BS47DRAFT_1292441 [Hydnum rufescens UP504]|uniref:Carbonic anhydrase n=1 Tax=Hydnum rufescens UP504 TaxID=1448309 RepID=A0A9P6DVG2_9AGAM|nr:hypothetical protein BS47DRAFT_1292441 [Hydnum rufescens UP504]